MRGDDRIPLKDFELPNGAVIEASVTVYELKESSVWTIGSFTALALAALTIACSSVGATLGSKLVGGFWATTAGASIGFTGFALFLTLRNASRAARLGKKYALIEGAVIGAGALPEQAVAFRIPRSWLSQEFQK